MHVRPSAHRFTARVTTRMVTGAAAALAVTLAVPFATPALAATADAVDPQQTACPTDRVPPVGFVDIDGDTFQNEIKCIADYTLTKGVDEDHYAPRRAVTRAQMATFIYRFLQFAGEAPTDTSPVDFVDIAEQSQEFQDAINGLAHAGVTKGVDARHFVPNRPVLRGEMAAFIDRAQDLIDDGFAADGDYFTDDESSVLEDEINAIATVGIVHGTSPSQYDPNEAVTRSQMAGYLSRDLEVNTRRDNVPTIYPHQ